MEIRVMWPFSSEDKDKKIESLEEKVSKLQEEEDRWRKRFEAEKERRSELAKKKQEADERVNRLEDKVEGLKSGGQKSKSTEGSSQSFENKDMGFEEAIRVIEKLSSVRSTDADLVTVYCSGNRDDIGDVRGLKNSVSGKQFQNISDSGVYLFDDDGLFDIFVNVRPFFESEWFSGESFDLDEVQDFISRDKIWVKVSAGDSRIFRESDGELELVQHVKDRVDRQHSSGGFSQGRFERKRDEQIQGHVENVEDAIPDGDDVFLVGEKDLCGELPGEHLGGFDPNSSDLEALYGFSFRRL